MATFAVVVVAWVGRAVELLLVPTTVERVVVIGSTTAIDCDPAVLAKPSWLVCSSLGSSPSTACGGRGGGGGGGARCGADECCHSGVALVLFEAAVVVVEPFLCSSPSSRFRNKDSEVATVAGGGGGVVLRVVVLVVVLVVVRVLLNGVSEPLVSRKVAKNEATSWPASMLRFNASDGVEVATELGCCCFFCVMLLLLLLLLLLLFPKRGSGAP
jgi:hypothetical protein